MNIRQYLNNTDITNKELELIKAKIAVLEKNDENTLEAINDLSEEMRNELDDVYMALSQLAAKAKNSNPIKKIGFKQ